MNKNDGLLRVIVSNSAEMSIGYRVWIRYSTVLDNKKQDFC